MLDETNAGSLKHYRTAFQLVKENAPNITRMRMTGKTCSTRRCAAIRRGEEVSKKTCRRRVEEMTAGADGLWTQPTKYLLRRAWINWYLTGGETTRSCSADAREEGTGELHIVVVTTCSRSRMAVW